MIPCRTGRQFARFSGQARLPTTAIIVRHPACWIASSHHIFVPGLKLPTATPRAALLNPSIHWHLQGARSIANPSTSRVLWAAGNFILFPAPPGCSILPWCLPLPQLFSCHLQAWRHFKPAPSLMLHKQISCDLWWWEAHLHHDHRVLGSAKPVALGLSESESISKPTSTSNHSCNSPSAETAALQLFSHPLFSCHASCGQRDVTRYHYWFGSQEAWEDLRPESRVSGLIALFHQSLNASGWLVSSINRKRNKCHVATWKNKVAADCLYWQILTGSADARTIIVILEISCLRMKGCKQLLLTRHARHDIGPRKSMYGQFSCMNSRRPWICYKPINYCEWHRSPGKLTVSWRPKSVAAVDIVILYSIL